jgi:hypothetical protein
MADELVTYVKRGNDGNIIERTAATPRDHVQFRGTGWVRKDSSLGRQVTGSKKADSVEGQSATSVTAHATAANAVHPPAASKPTKS